MRRRRLALTARDYAPDDRSEERREGEPFLWETSYKNADRNGYPAARSRCGSLDRWFDAGFDSLWKSGHAPNG